MGIDMVLRLMEEGMDQWEDMDQWEGTEGWVLWVTEG